MLQNRIIILQLLHRLCQFTLHSSELGLWPVERGNVRFLSSSSRSSSVAMAWIWGAIIRLEGYVRGLVPSSLSSTSLPFRPTQLNDNVYELCKPQGRPSIEVVFFHGLPLYGSGEAYLTTWFSGDDNCTELWPCWIAECVPKARILLVSYDGFATGMYVTSENLVLSLTDDTAQVGRDGCPVILVGHSLGGLVMKELLLRANSILTLDKRDNPNEDVQCLLESLKQLFYYATPNIETARRGRLAKFLTTINTGAGLFEFSMLRLSYKWRADGIAAGLPVNLGKFKDKLLVPDKTSDATSQIQFLVEEASARYDVDTFYTVDADHFDVCRPKSKTDSRFLRLMDVIDHVLKEDVAGHKMRFPNEVVGLDDQVEIVKEALKRARRLGIVGTKGIGKSTLAKAVYNSISGDFEYTCFLSNVKNSIDKTDTMEALQSKILESLCYKGRRKKVKWSRLRGKKILLIFDDIESCKIMDDSSFEGFADESCVLVTSIDSWFVRSLGFEVHDAVFLDDEASNRLFWLHACKGASAPEVYINRMASFVKKCGGWPWALELSGEYAYIILSQAMSQGGSQDDKLWSIFQETENAEQSTLRSREDSKIPLLQTEEDRWNYLDSKTMAAATLATRKKLDEIQHFIRMLHFHVIDGKRPDVIFWRPEMVEDFIREVSNSDETGYFVCKTWLFSRQEHEWEEVMLVLERFGYKETYQNSTTMFYERMEDDVQVPNTCIDPACTTDNNDIFVGDTKQVISSDDISKIEETVLNAEKHDGTFHLTSKTESGHAQLCKTSATTTSEYTRGHAPNNPATQRETTNCEKNNIADDSKSSSEVQQSGDFLPSDKQGLHRGFVSPNVTHASPKADAKCVCPPEHLTVSFTPPSESPESSSTSSPEGEHVSTRSVSIRGRGCDVTLPRAERLVNVSTAVARDIFMTTVQYNGASGWEDACVSLNVCAETTLRCCRRRDGNNKRVRIELLRIGGAMKMNEPVFDHVNSNALVLKAVRTNFDASLNNTPIFLEGPPERIVLKQFLPTDSKGQRQDAQDLLWLEPTRETPLNSETGSTTLELGCHPRQKLVVDVEESSHKALVLDSGSFPVNFEGEIYGDLDSNSSLEFDVRYQSEISYIQPRKPLPQPNHPTGAFRRVSRVVDYDCLLKYRIQPKSVA